MVAVVLYAIFGLFKVVSDLPCHLNLNEEVEKSAQIYLKSRTDW